MCGELGQKCDFWEITGWEKRTLVLLKRGRHLNKTAMAGQTDIITLIKC